MYKLIVVLACTLTLAACAPEKPPLDATQTVNGKSIIIPPEFDVRP